MKKKTFLWSDDGAVVLDYNWESNTVMLLGVVVVVVVSYRRIEKETA